MARIRGWAGRRNGGVIALIAVATERSPKKIEAHGAPQAVEEAGRRIETNGGAAEDAPIRLAGDP